MGVIKDTSVNFENKEQLKLSCTGIYANNLIAGQWTLTIVCALFPGKLRFGQLKKQIPNITERMLTLQLRKMEADYLVKRTVYAEVPPRVEYELTLIGMKLRPIMDLLDEWGMEHKITVTSQQTASKLQK